MDLRSIYIANGIGIFILLILRYVSRAQTQRRNVEDQLFTAMIFGVMLGCFMEAFSYAIDGQMFTGSRALNYVANLYLYCANILLPFSVLVYVDIGLYGDKSRILKHYKPQIIVGAIMLAINFMSIFFPLSFYITEQNVYERRPLCYASYVVIFYYLVSAYVLTRRYEKENGTRRFFTITLFVAPILIGTGLQFIFYGLSLAWPSAAIGLVGLFMMQQNELAYIDSLVDVYNRQYLNRLMYTWIACGDSFVGVMLDVDGFKGINDTYGHSEGDVALKAVADILKRSAHDGEWIFRFAGDEFIVLKKTDSPDGLTPFINAMEDNLEAFNRAGHLYELSLSYGTSFFESGSIDDFIKEMDDKMYEMKAQHHALKRSGGEQASVA